MSLSSAPYRRFTKLSPHATDLCIQMILLFLQIFLFFHAAALAACMHVDGFAASTVWYVPATVVAEVIVSFWLFSVLKCWVERMNFDCWKTASLLCSSILIRRCFTRLTIIFHQISRCHFIAFTLVLFKLPASKSYHKEYGGGRWRQDVYYV